MDPETNLKSMVPIDLTQAKERGNLTYQVLIKYFEDFSF